jgi:hypothetical protein
MSAAQMNQMIAEAQAMIVKMQAQLALLSKPAKVSKAKDESKPKKPASQGTMAWHAFVAHVQETQPSRFADFKKHSDVLHEAKTIREEDDAAYKAFVAEWKTTHISSETASVDTVAEEVVVVPQKDKKKVAVGTMAWHAFVKHCKDTMPEISSLATNAERLQAIKARKETDAPAYETFVNEWKTAQPVA